MKDVYRRRPENRPFRILALLERYQRRIGSVGSRYPYNKNAAQRVSAYYERAHAAAWILRDMLHSAATERRLEGRR